MKFNITTLESLLDDLQEANEKEEFEQLKTIQKILLRVLNFKSEEEKMKWLDYLFTFSCFEDFKKYTLKIGIKENFKKYKLYIYFLNGGYDVMIFNDRVKLFEYIDLI